MIAGADAFFTADTALFLAAALGRTLVMTIIGCSIGLGLGGALAVLRGSRARWLTPARALAALYIEIFRRLPFLVILMLVLFCVQAIAPDLSLIGVATIAVTLAASAYLSEIVRAGLESVPQAQRDSAATLGLSWLDTLRLVILPQAWGVILPPAAAFMVMFIKDTALASQLGVVELAFAGKILVGKGVSPVLGFGAVLLLYALLSWPLGRAAQALETLLETRRGAAHHR
ncbi:MAG: amino acid ABC transporter permease [Sandarakinorhabdus sp.]